MKSIVMLFFVVGIIMLSVGYQRKILTNTKTKTIVEYRYIPRSIYEEQLSPINLQDTFHSMFSKGDVFLKNA
tara:strand:+ start:1007 stop:1222 length:216 start_codon:yes stop_codon:yes gene_type:complete